MKKWSPTLRSDIGLFIFIIIVCIIVIAAFGFTTFATAFVCGALLVAAAIIMSK